MNAWNFLDPVTNRVHGGHWLVDTDPRVSFMLAGKEDMYR